MPTSVYVVMAGNYEGDWIEGIYATRESVMKVHPGKWQQFAPDQWRGPRGLVLSVHRVQEG